MKSQGIKFVLTTGASLEKYKSSYCIHGRHVAVLGLNIDQRLSLCSLRAVLGEILVK